MVTQLVVGNEKLQHKSDNFSTKISRKLLKQDVSKLQYQKVTGNQGSKTETRKCVLQTTVHQGQVKNSNKTK